MNEYKERINKLGQEWIQGHGMDNMEQNYGHKERKRYWDIGMDTRQGEEWNQ